MSAQEEQQQQQQQQQQPVSQSQQQIKDNSNMFGGFTLKQDPQQQKYKNTPNFTLQVENGFLNDNYKLKSKVDLFVKVFIENQHFRTHISVDCGRNPVWGKEATFPFFENQFVEKNYLMQIELWNYETELGDVQLGVGMLDLMDSFNSSLKQNKIPIYDSKNMQQQIGFISVITKFAYNFIGKIKKEQNKFGQPLKFTKPVLIEGNKITKSDVQERQASFEERMKNLKEKYNIQSSKKDTTKFMDIEISQDIYKAIHQGMVLIGKNRPENPIRELGLFLYNYSGQIQN
ncbi:hypothetical protein ABPG74_017781 [Tetrahymena malaccensis]